MRKRLIFTLIIILFLGVMVHGVFAQSISTYPEIPYFEGYYGTYDYIYNYGFIQDSYGNVYLCEGISPQTEPLSSSTTGSMPSSSLTKARPLPIPPTYPYCVNLFGFPSYTLSGTTPVTVPPTSTAKIGIIRAVRYFAYGTPQPEPTPRLSLYKGTSTRARVPLSLNKATPLPTPPTYPYCVNLFGFPSYRLYEIGSQPDPYTYTAQISPKSRARGSFTEVNPQPEPAISTYWISPITELPQYSFWLNLFSLSPQPEPPDIFFR